jgi:IS5 family transposase
MKNKARGLFDEQFRLEKISQQNDPLVRLNTHIDFEFFRKPLEGYFTKEKEEEEDKGGRPAYDYVMMFKILILQRYYNLSDDNTEYAILDRLSFMRFLGLTISDSVPDAKTIWNFKNELSKGDMVNKLFKKLHKRLDHEGVIMHAGKMADATIVETPRQRNSREENEQIKAGGIPEEWEQNPNKLRQKDRDAAWFKKNGETYYGYKDHIKADTATKLITDYEVTSGSVHDSAVLENLLDKKEDQGQPLYADSAYRSEAIEEELIKKGIKSQIHEKGYRGRPLTKRQQQRNRKKSKVRVRVEHIFAFMENSMQGIYIYCRNLVRAKTTIGLMNITYNLFRLTQLKVCLSRV